MSSMSALSQGFYTSREAAQLIEVGNLRRIRSWLDGSPGSIVGPLLKRDYHAVYKRAPQELSFFDLIEVRFVEFFRENGVKTHTLRAALEVARETFGKRPFATNKIRFVVSQDKKIYVQESSIPIASIADDPKFWNLVKKQYEIVEVLHSKIEQGLIFDANTELAKQWRPRIEKYPSIIIDPKKAYGQPVIDCGLPTRLIFDTWKAEEKNIDLVSEWLDIPSFQVKAAVNFEAELIKEKGIE